MPITPKFSLSQNDEFVIVDIKLPHIRISMTELIADGKEFSFYCKPYLLKLVFPFELLGDDERCKATYDACKDNGTMLAYLPKSIPGQIFPDLDLTTKLLQRASDVVYSSGNCGPRVEVLNSSDASSGLENTEGDDKVCSQETELLTETLSPHYGFNQKYCAILKNLKEEMIDVIELPEPETIPWNIRRNLRISAENELFDPLRYLGDMFSAETDDVYTEALSYDTFWDRQWAAKKKIGMQNYSDSNPVVDRFCRDQASDAAFESAGGFDEMDNQILSNGLPRREYLIKSGSEEEYQLLLGLADLLFAFAFEHRLTCGEASVESASNITRLSSLLSWLDGFMHPGDNAYTVVLHSCRRSLIYPYLRVWKLTRKIRRILEHTDTHYLLNKLFLDDYCVWVQTLGEASLKQFARQYNDAKAALESDRVPPASVLAGAGAGGGARAGAGAGAGVESGVKAKATKSTTHSDSLQAVDPSDSSAVGGPVIATAAVMHDEGSTKHSGDVEPNCQTQPALIEVRTSRRLGTAEEAKAMAMLPPQKPLTTRSGDQIPQVGTLSHAGVGNPDQADGVESGEQYELGTDTAQRKEALRELSAQSQSLHMSVEGKKIVVETEVEKLHRSAEPDELAHIEVKPTLVMDAASISSSVAARVVGPVGPVGKAALGLNLVAIEEWGRQQARLLEEGLLNEPAEFPADLWPPASESVEDAGVATGGLLRGYSQRDAGSPPGGLLTSDVSALLGQLKLAKSDGT